MLEPVFRGSVGEGAVAVIYVQHIPTAQCEMGDRRDVDVEVPVAIDVGHRDAGRPALHLSHTGPLRDVLEPEIALVAIEPVGTEIRREVQVRQAVAINVAGGHAPTVVVVQIIDDVDLGRFRQLIDERHPGHFRGEKLEQRCGAVAAGQRQQARSKQQLPSPACHKSGGMLPSAHRRERRDRRGFWTG